jgi:hypothetical protein
MVFFRWGTLSDERTGLSFVYAAGPRQRSLTRVRVPRDSWSYFAVSDLRLRFSSPPTTRRVTVVFDPASTEVAKLRPAYKLSTLTASKVPSLLRLDSLPHRCVYCAVATQRPRREPQKTLLPTVALLLRVDSLPWEPVCLRSLSCNASTRYSMLPHIAHCCFTCEKT